MMALGPPNHWVLPLTGGQGLQKPKASQKKPQSINQRQDGALQGILKTLEHLTIKGDWIDLKMLE